MSSTKRLATSYEASEPLAGSGMEWAFTLADRTAHRLRFGAPFALSGWRVNLLTSHLSPHSSRHGRNDLLRASTDDVTAEAKLHD